MVSVRFAVSAVHMAANEHSKCLTSIWSSYILVRYFRILSII